jgi:2-polyprenyl-3-methyl-5-hydroxy-6-metoxy-1,4-benzoquinol methylase
MSSTLPLWKRCLDPAVQEAGHYQDYVNTSLFNLFDGTPRRVLDLGCAAGAFGAALKERMPGAAVVGVEAGHGASQQAAQRLDRVIRSRIEDLDFEREGLQPGEFDAVVAADILEHLVNPWELLDELRTYLAPNGQVIASIPNVRNLTVSAALLGDGRFDYDERGLLDITHLRFFTRGSINQLFAETGYRVEAMVGLMPPDMEAVYKNSAGQGAKQLKMGRLVLNDVTPGEMLELCTVQFLLRARPV